MSMTRNHLHRAIITCGSGSSTATRHPGEQICFGLRVALAVNAVSEEEAMQGHREPQNLITVC